VQKGKEYVVEDGDIILFRFNVGKGKWLEDI
jgi:ribosome-binding ATPase YchF (GTP1/OBG family)